MSSRKPTEKIEKLQAHVAEVSNIMTENINKILDRGQRLDDLEGRSGESSLPSEKSDAPVADSSPLSPRRR